MHIQGCREVNVHVLGLDPHLGMRVPERVLPVQCFVFGNAGDAKVVAACSLHTFALRQLIEPMDDGRLSKPQVGCDS